MSRKIPLTWLFFCVGVTGAIVSPVLAGFAPIAGDPELLYQPLKLELARALAVGELPFWSDKFGLGMPLVAESHVAAFYPLNWLFLRLWNVDVAYRLALWLHWLALPAATYAYARGIEMSEAGSALAAICFSLCGFQAIHSVHEPIVHVMPYVPLCLCLADRYVVTGRFAYAAALALAWGLQLTLGHFQLQMWTGGLVAFTGAWRAVTTAGSPRSKITRTLGLLLALAWGAAIATVQLHLTWELIARTSFFRPAEFLSNYVFPLAHWAQFGLPEVYLGRPGGSGKEYWEGHNTTAGEACAYVGVVPFLLAGVGFLASDRKWLLAPWRVILLLSFGLATMADWGFDFYFLLLQLPGIGWFRAPARYTLLTSLALALFAGRGLDQTIGGSRFRIGLSLSIIGGAVAWAWSVLYARSPDFQRGMGPDTLALRFIASGAFWVLGLIAIVACRRKRLRSWAPVLLTSLELGPLLFVGPSSWRSSVRLPDSSPLLQALAETPDVGLVAGRLLNVPVFAGQSAARTYLGITPPPPNDLLERATNPPARSSEQDLRWQRRFGVTHGVWAASDNTRGTEVLATIADPVLDQVMSAVPRPRNGSLGPWQLVRYPGAFPRAWVCSGVREAPSWGKLKSELSQADDPNVAWFLAADKIPPLSEPIARAPRVQSYDGETAVVEHDGSCVLVLRRTYYPGWTYSVDGGPEHPVVPVNGGLQGIPLAKSATSRIRLRYRPTGLARALTVSVTALGAAVCLLAVAAIRSAWRPAQK